MPSCSASKNRHCVSAKIYFFLYIGALVALSMFTTPLPLVAVVGILALLGGRAFLKLARRALVLVALFSLLITVSYSITLHLQDQPFWTYFITVNLRSFDMVLLTLVFTHRVNLYEALSFSEELSFLLTLSVAKIMTMQRSFADYRDALKSRTMKKPSRSEAYEYLGSAAAGFLERNIREGKENFEAMRSRGFGA